MNYQRGRESVEEAVRVGDNPGCGQCHERTQGRRLAFKRNPIEQPSIYVVVKGRVVLYEVSCTFDRNALGRTGDSETDTDVQWDAGSNVNVLSVGCKSLPGHAEMIGIERNIRDTECT